MEKTKSALTFDLTTVITDRDGNEIPRKPGEKLTLRTAILDSIEQRVQADYAQGAHLGFNILTSIYNKIDVAETDITLTSEQITAICDRVSMVQGPGAITRAVLKMINPALLD